MTTHKDTWPRLQVTYEETHHGIALWVQTRNASQANAILLDADQTHVFLRGLTESIDGETDPLVINGKDWPRLEVAWDAAVGKVAIWLQPRPDGPRGPILRTVGAARGLIAALERAISERDRLRGDLEEINNADPDDFG